MPEDLTLNIDHPRFGFDVTKCLSYLGDGWYQVDTPLTFTDPAARHQGRYFQVSVPLGLITDLASIPQPFHSFIPPWWPARAAVVHDWLYKLLKIDADRYGVTKHWKARRYMADRIFFDALPFSTYRHGTRKFPATYRQICYRVVRLFGQRSCLKSSPMNMMRDVDEGSVPNIRDVLPLDSNGNPYWTMTN